jgi:Protein of unknown function (DUF3716)
MTGGKFGECRRLAGYWKGACASCRWKDHTQRCSLVRPGEAKRDLTSIAEVMAPSRFMEVDEEENEAGSSYEYPVELD